MIMLTDQSVIIKRDHSNTVKAFEDSRLWSVNARSGAPRIHKRHAGSR